ncbi:MAG: hypothetical protein KY410_08380 [Proteobacteria bacterium]|nr:hypothetical protein [Pseudomonadota bacterium]
MNTVLLATFLLLQPADPLETEFRRQQANAIRDISVDIQADLEHKGAEYFAAEGSLQRQLEGAIVVKRELAAR